MPTAQYWKHKQLINLHIYGLANKIIWSACHLSSKLYCLYLHHLSSQIYLSGMFFLPEANNYVALKGERELMKLSNKKHKKLFSLFTKLLQGIQQRQQRLICWTVYYHFKGMYETEC